MATIYDDGEFSGGSIGRPALAQRIADIGKRRENGGNLREKQGIETAWL
jgi:hypothetical protein